MKNFIPKLTSIYNQIKTLPKLQIISIASALFVIFVIAILVWLHASRFISTEDAYINANIV